MNNFNSRLPILGCAYLAMSFFGCTGTTPGIGLSGVAKYQVVCGASDDCSPADAMHSTIEVDDQSRVVGVTQCLLDQYFNVPVGDGWQGVYVSPDGNGDGLSPFRPIALRDVAPAEKLYISLMPGRYEDFETLVAKAEVAIRIVSPCAGDHVIGVPEAGLHLVGPREIVLRGLSFDIAGTNGVNLANDVRAWVHESRFKGSSDQVIGLRVSGADRLWLSQVKFEGLGIGAMVQAREVRLDDVWFDGQAQGALVAMGDARYERNRGPAQSLVGLVGDGLKVDFGGEAAFGLSFGLVGASLRHVELSDYEGELSSGLRFWGSVALVEHLRSLAPAHPVISTNQSVVWLRDGVITGGVQAVYAASGSSENPLGDGVVSAFFDEISDNVLLAGDVVFSSGLYNTVEPPLALTDFENDAFYQPRSAALTPFGLPVTVSMNDFQFLFPGASKVAPQLESDARLADQTVIALGPNLNVERSLGVGVFVENGAVFVGSGLSVTGTRASGFVRSDRLNGGGHGVQAVRPGAFVLEGGTVSGSDGVGVLVRPSQPVRLTEAGQTRVSVSGGVSLLDNHLGGLWLQGEATPQGPGGTARVSDVTFSGNRLFSMYGSGLDLVLRGCRSEGVREGALALNCPPSSTCTPPAAELLPFFDEFHFHGVSVLRLLDLELADMAPRPIFLHDVVDAVVEPFPTDGILETQQTGAPDSGERLFIDGTIMWDLGSQ